MIHLQLLNDITISTHPHKIPHESVKNNGDKISWYFIHPVDALDLEMKQQ